MKKSELRQIIRETIIETISKETINECWKGYVKKGMKKKGNKMVPNCVPQNEEVDENLNQWFKDDWVRVDTQGNIAGKCGTMKKGKKTQRCLPKSKAQSLSKKQRASTSKKKTKSSKQYVSNTKAAGGRKKRKK
tara:strand:+ start:3993 stop:4394 length:402 start_codon:yes stop_codon:yes gene_type:complete